MPDCIASKNQNLPNEQLSSWLVSSWAVEQFPSKLSSWAAEQLSSWAVEQSPSKLSSERLSSEQLSRKLFSWAAEPPSSETNHCFLIAAGVSAEGSSLLWVDRQLQQIQILHITSTNTNTLPVQFLQKVVPSWLKTKGITTSIVFLILSWSTTAKKRQLLCFS